MEVPAAEEEGAAGRGPGHVVVAGGELPWPGEPLPGHRGQQGAGGGLPLPRTRSQSGQGVHLAAWPHPCINMEMDSDAVQSLF